MNNCQNAMAANADQYTPIVSLPPTMFLLFCWGRVYFGLDGLALMPVVLWPLDRWLRLLL
jgi:hypothetical protein